MGQEGRTERDKHCEGQETLLFLDIFLPHYVALVVLDLNIYRPRQAWPPPHTDLPARLPIAAMGARDGSVVKSMSCTPYPIRWVTTPYNNSRGSNVL